MSFVVFHPSVAPFVQHAACALHEGGQLNRLVTTVQDEPASRRQRFLCALGRTVGSDLRAQFRRRAVTEIPASLVETNPWGELLRLAVSRADRDGRLTDLVWERNETGFDRWVARKLHRGLTGVYGFEHSSQATFQRARALGLRVVYDLPSPETVFVHGLLDRELDRFPELRTAYHSHTARREERRLARRRAEWASADVIVTASQFTRDSFARAGLDVSRARVVHYGAPPTAARDEALPPEKARAGVPTFIWAGTFSVRKGAHYLLEAWRKGGFGRHARLLVFGAVALPERVLRPLPEGVELRGSVPRSELMAHYQQGEALMFPTLCDGFGMVVTEAWSRGLPVITTERAGAADLLKPDQNGRLIRAGSSDAIAESLEWCLAHRPELRAMREGALATAAAWQWQDYRRALREAVLSEEPIVLP